MKRVWFLMEGSPSACEAQFSFKVFEEKDSVQKFSMSLILEKIWIEQSNDLVRNLAEVAIAFNPISKLSGFQISSPG